ncbi:hypothetical protein [Salinicoccus roseus]|uniref:hypothetical protein n=1 Tax=Salinicoccus roseus TaxID=45670 RepID=UPI0023007697|nr:hypothetical protein [Salinicoccus roseus]
MANIPNIQASHNSESRNILNLTIDTVNTMDGTVTKTKNDLNNFINGAGVVTDRHLAQGSVTSTRIADGAVSRTKISSTVDGVMINKGTTFPLVNYTVDGVAVDFHQKAKDIVLSAKVENADPAKVYRLSSIRNGYNNAYGLTIDSFNFDENGNIDTTTQKREIQYYLNEPSLYPTRFSYSEDGSIGTVTAKSPAGLTVTVVFDAAELAANQNNILNNAENEIGTSQGAVIANVNYSYFTEVEGEEVVSYNNQVVVDKTDTDMIVYVKTKGNLYTGYHLYRVTKPFVEGEQRSNLDLWSIGRVSTYEREGETFTEDTSKVFVYSAINEPTYTNDTIFKLAGASDYSGGFMHGDEKIQAFNIIAGQGHITNLTGRFEGSSVELIQRTHIFRDTSTSTTGDTSAFLEVKKSHRFSTSEGYTLVTKLKALEDFTPNFSSIGGWQMKRTFENGSANNITDIFDMTNIKRVNVRVSDSVDKHFTGEDTTDYKVCGFFKDIAMHYESDSDYFDTWMRNWADDEMKIYSKVFPDNELVTAGTEVNASVNYKISVY